MNIEKRSYIIYVDGACPNNGKPGARAGWGAYLVNDRGEELDLAGPIPASDPQTNSRAEVMAMVTGLEAIKKASILHVHSDSDYVVKGINQWMEGWRAKGWRTAKGEVAHSDLWRRIYEATKFHEVTATWVRGHSGVIGNERADRLANRGMVGERVHERACPQVI